MWVMELRIDGAWKPIQGVDMRYPYYFKTKAEAERMLRICYPDQVRDARLGFDSIVRVREESDEGSTGE